MVAVPHRVLGWRYRVYILQDGPENAVFEAGTHEGVEGGAENVYEETCKRISDGLALSVHDGDRRWQAKVHMSAR